MKNKKSQLAKKLFEDYLKIYLYKKGWNDAAWKQFWFSLYSMFNRFNICNLFLNLAIPILKTKHPPYLVTILQFYIFTALTE